MGLDILGIIQLNFNHLIYHHCTYSHITVISYPIFILNVDIDSLVKKVIHFFDMVTFRCQVQGSHLVEKKKLLKNSTELCSQMYGGPEGRPLQMLPCDYSVPSLLS